MNPEDRLRIDKKLPILLLLAALLACPFTMAFAAAQVTISSPAGNGVFELQGSGFTDVGGVKVTILYDPATLANPRVTDGGLMSGALMAVNANSPGFLVLGLMSRDGKGFSGSGSLASISFDLPGNSLGVIKSITAEVTSVKATKIEAQAFFFNPSGSKSDTPQGGIVTGSDSGTGPGSGTGTVSGSGSGTGTGSYIVGGNVTVPGGGDVSKPATEKPKEETTAEAATQQKEAPAVPGPGDKEAIKPPPETPAAAPTGKSAAALATPRSVLEQFRAYQGAKTPQALVAIFKQNAVKGIRQEPSVAMSDGITPVRILIDLPAQEKSAPNFALKGAKLMSLKTEGENTWVVEALPAKGVYEATVKVLNDGSVIEIPLTVTPPLPREAKPGKGDGLTEDDFKIFLKETGTAKTPRFDLNSDGKRDYIDDYIFTANYIVASQRGKR